MNSHLFTLKKSSTFTNLLIEKPGIDLLHLVFFYKQPRSQPHSGLNPVSLSNNKNYRLKRNRVSPLQ